MRSIVLLSGGLDSAVALAMAVKETSVALCLTIDYGQRAAANEIKSSRDLADYYELNHKILEIPVYQDMTTSALLKKDSRLPTPFNLEDKEATKSSAAEVWVPNRNGLFINLAACYADAMQCHYIVTGFNTEEAETFPDNSLAFVQATNKTLSFSTRNGVKVISYTQQLDKTEIVRLGQRLNVPFNLIWSCYESGENMCGKCESCLRLLRAQKKAGALID